MLSLAVTGPIPAHAGQPLPACPIGPRGWAYPRSRGATLLRLLSVSLDRGLSPLTRGNRDHAVAPWRNPGPIPAHAGQPRKATPSPDKRRAYPRSRGATVRDQTNFANSSGLSPLTRGNRHRAGGGILPVGPIPAHAGQPRPSCAAVWSRRAYPRSRGATHANRNELGCPAGLSPLTRGNHARLRGRQPGRGPIPAHAGQPAGRPPPCCSPRAYPRSRGATPMRHIVPTLGSGLSPLTRGNRGQRQGMGIVPGPIPAHAGQPRPAAASRRRGRAYPRSRGATRSAVTERWRLTGLSPLTRGNRAGGHHRGGLLGPIPAHAGQPTTTCAPPATMRAYPRSRGATATRPATCRPSAGLSPLTRGNR